MPGEGKGRGGGGGNGAENEGWGYRKYIFCMLKCYCDKNKSKHTTHDGCTETTTMFANLECWRRKL